MRPNRRAQRRTIELRTALTVVAIVTALGLVPIAMSIQSGTSDATSDTTVPAGTGQDSSAQTGETNQAQGDIGPLNEIDKKFLVAVRQAGLWEIPAGRLAQTHASSEAVKRAGLHLLDGHSKLDQLVREDAKLLGVQIPNEAKPEQQAWVKQLEGARGAEFDRLFANLLRASHGKIFTTIAQVRGATQNDIIRRHARQANQAVLDHMEVLEDTGLVDAETLRDVGAAVMSQR